MDTPVWEPHLVAPPGSAAPVAGVPSEGRNTDSSPKMSLVWRLGKGHANNCLKAAATYSFLCHRHENGGSELVSDFNVTVLRVETSCSRWDP